MELVELEIFCIVVVEGGVICVVEWFNWVQFNVIMCIKQLEEFIGVFFFVCDCKCLVFIVLGEVLLDYVECIFDLVQEVCEVVLLQNLCGCLCIGFMESVVVSCLLVFLVEFYQCWFEVWLELLIGLIDVLIVGVCVGKLDVVLVVGFIEDGVLFVILLYKEELLLVMLCSYCWVCLFEDVMFDILIVFEQGCVYCCYVESWFVG